MNWEPRQRRWLGWEQGVVAVRGKRGSRCDEME